METIKNICYITAEKYLRDKKEYSVDLVRSALSITSFEYNSLTQYSYICNLKSGRVYLYHFHNFEDVVTLDLKNELLKGKHEVDLPSLFPIKSFAYQNYLERSPHAKFYDIINKNGLDTAIICYRYSKNLSISNHYDITESDFNTMAYRFLNENRILDAILLFKFISEEYPKSWNAFDSLAEAYMINEQTDLAIKNYNRSLELNPDNENAKEMLKKS